MPSLTRIGSYLLGLTLLLVAKPALHPSGKGAYRAHAPKACAQLKSGEGSCPP